MESLLQISTLHYLVLAAALFILGVIGVLTRRNVIVGSPNNGQIPVLKGIEPGETVVIQGGILIDNQIQLDN